MTGLRERLAYGLVVSRRKMMIPRFYKSLMSEGQRQKGHKLLTDTLSFIITDHIQTITVDSISADFHVTNGIEFSVLHTAIISNHSEHDIITDFLDELRSGDVVYDIGANIGLYTCLSAQVVDEGEVHAFEPVPQNSDRIRNNVSLNEQENRVTVHELAVTNESGEKTFNIERDTIGTVGSSLDFDYDDSITVKAAKLDEKIPTIPAPDVMKIDAEGTEYKVFKGIEDQLGQIRTIYCEFHPIMQDAGDSTRIKDLLEENGYTVTTLDQRGDMEFIKATLDEQA